MKILPLNESARSFRRSTATALLLLLFALPICGQTPEACRKQLRHLDVDDYGEAYSFRPGSNPKVKLPTRLLSSDGGIEVYAATFPDGRDNFYSKIANTGMRILVVYQDEAVRQAMIKELRDKHMLPPAGFGALPANLKYLEVWFLPDSDSVVYGQRFSGLRWHIATLRYLQPQQCQNVFQNDVHVGRPWSREDSRWTGDEVSVEEVTSTDTQKDVGLRVDSSPLLPKALQAMLAWAKQCSALVDPPEKM